MAKKSGYDDILQDIVSQRLVEYLTDVNPMSYERTAQVINDYCAAAGIAFTTNDSSITNYCGHGDRPCTPPLSFLTALCSAVKNSAFPCSVDWFAGLASIPSPDTDKQAAARYLGCGEKTLDALQRIFHFTPSANKLPTEKIVQSPEFRKLFLYFGNYLFAQRDIVRNAELDEIIAAAAETEGACVYLWGNMEQAEEEYQNMLRRYTEPYTNKDLALYNISRAAAKAAESVDDLVRKDYEKTAPPAPGKTPKGNRAKKP